MSGTPFLVARLDATHDRKGFCSGSEPLDRYFREQSTQDIRRRISTCFVALTPERRVAAYYTLAALSVWLADLPADIARKLPRYHAVPTTRMGRLAVDREFRGIGLGASLLADALERAIRSEIATYALVVDAKDEAAAAFYLHHGFIALPGAPSTLFLPLASVQ